MKYMLRKIIALAVVVLSIGVVTAQTNFADFRIKAKDQDGRNLSGVKIVMLLNNIEVASDTTDSDGNAGFTTLTPGKYDVQATKEGYRDQEVRGISLQPGQNPSEDLDFVKLGSGSMEAAVIKVKGKRSPVNFLQSESVIDGAKIVGSGQRGTGLLESTNSAILSTPQGISVRGTRADGNGTFIDGQRVIGGGGLPTLGTEQISANVGGIPAMYGDLTGGVFSSTSKSATDKIVTAIEGITSSGLDPFGYNTVEGFISGPIWVKEEKDASGKTKRNVKLGYMMNANLGYYKDPAPTRTGVYRVNEQKLQEIENNPLIFTPNGFVHSASFLRMEDFELMKARPNSDGGNGNFVGKLEWRPSQYVSVTGYASYFYSTGLAASNSVMNYKNNSRSDNQTFRGYLLFTQNFKTNKESSIKNAYYSVRAEYQNTYALPVMPGTWTICSIMVTSASFSRIQQRYISMPTTIHHRTQTKIQRLCATSSVTMYS